MDTAIRDARASTVTRPRRGLTVRTWILVAVFGLSAVALATAGLTAARLQDAHVEARIDDSLRASAEEFRVLADVGVDPDTGEAFATPEDLVRASLERTIPSRHEGVLGVVDGEIAYTSRGAPVALEDDPELVAALGPLVTGQDAALETITTQRTTYRVAAVPVRTAIDGTLVESPTEPGASEGPVAALVVGFDLTAELSDFQRVFRTYALVAALSLAVVTAVGWLVSGRLLRPIRVLAASARRIGREDLSERIPVSGNDDLADMTRAVNEMLTRLESAFDAQRVLVGDVSHELRTPLTVVRGHLEVMDGSDPADVTDTRDLVLDEIDRMDRVIGDLSTLAFSDRPDFVRPEPCDLGTLTDEIFDKSVALGNRSWHLEMRGEGVVDVDRQRLTQAALQLAANAVKFSPPGSAIAIGSATTREQVRLWVADEGRGVAPEDLERVFERFERAGDRDTPGSGLGLAIVRAIARAHGGDATCASTLGAGSTFTITVAATSPEESTTTEGQP